MRYSPYIVDVYLNDAGNKALDNYSTFSTNGKKPIIWGWCDDTYSSRSFVSGKTDLGGRQLGHVPQPDGTGC